jgi:hypothetical protein
MPAKESKTAKEIERFAIEIIRRMQGCGHVEAVKVTSDPCDGWVISECTPGHADNSDVARAASVTTSWMMIREDRPGTTG